MLLWRSRVRYSLKAAALATGTLLVTPYLFMYDVMVLAIPVGFLVRIGLNDGFRRYELPALGAIAFLLMFYPLFGAPTGLGATLIVAALIGRRCLCRARALHPPCWQSTSAICDVVVIPGPAPSKSAVADLGNDNAELG